MINDHDLLSFIQASTLKRYTNSKSKILHKNIFDMLENQRENYSITNYAISIIFPELNIFHTWNQLQENYNKILQTIENPQNELQAAYTIIGIEIHRATKSNQKKEKQINNIKPLNLDLHEIPKKTKLIGKAHFHISLALYNDFLSPSLSEISILFNKAFNSTADIEIKKLSISDAKKWIIYATKESKDFKLQTFLQQNNLTHNHSSTALINYSPLLETDLKYLSQLLTKYDQKTPYEKRKSNVLKIEPVPYSDDIKVTMTWFIANLMKKENYAILAGTQKLYEKVENAHLTYKPSEKTLQTLFSELWMKVPKRAVQLLRSSATWILKQQSQLELTILPTITLNPQLIELQDGVYNFENCMFYSKETEETKLIPKKGSPPVFQNFNHKDLINISCSSYWPKEKYNQITFPIHTILHLKTYCNRPLESFLYRYGSVFHQREQSSPILYIYGEPGSGKTLIGQHAMSSVISEGNIGHILPTSQSSFKFSDVFEKWVIMLNDFRWGTIEETTLLNFLEGNTILVDQKYRTPTQWKAPHIIVTSNEELPNNPAILRRIDPYGFSRNPNYNRLPTKQLQQHATTTLNEALGFTILCNLVYLSKSQIIYVNQLPLNWTSNPRMMQIIHTIIPELSLKENP